MSECVLQVSVLLAEQAIELAVFFPFRVYRIQTYEIAGFPSRDQVEVNQPDLSSFTSTESTAKSRQEGHKVDPNDGNNTGEAVVNEPMDEESDEEDPEEDAGSLSVGGKMNELELEEGEASEHLSELEEEDDEDEEEDEEDADQEDVEMDVDHVEEDHDATEEADKSDSDDESMDEAEL